MIRGYRRELSVAVAYILILVFLAVFAPRFFLPDALRALVVRNAPVLVAAVGMTLVILCRQIDISVGSQFCVQLVVASMFAEKAAQSRYENPQPLHVRLLPRRRGGVS